MILRIAVPAPLRRNFDYLPPLEGLGNTGLVPGIRVTVPFGKRQMIGILVETVELASVDSERLKHAFKILDKTPVFNEELFSLLKWASEYYQYPLGMVLTNAIPALLRKGESFAIPTENRWRLTTAGQSLKLDQIPRAPRQVQLLSWMMSNGNTATAEQLNETEDKWRPIMAKLVAKAWVHIEQIREAETQPDITQDHPGIETGESIPRLNQAQQAAVASVLKQHAGYCAFLLDGVTGSGKTEVYLRIVAAVLKSRRQALVLVPEIGLTPQLIRRFRRRFNKTIAILHSGLTDTQRTRAWISAQTGQADIIIGTRSAVFAPLARPGVIIVDEEHDMSFKQQDGFRYCARDIAVIRAQRLLIPILLGSATPSLESLSNANLNRYRYLSLPKRAGEGNMPLVRIMDMRNQPMTDGLSKILLNSVSKHLAAGNQVLLFLNRRGYAPVLLCHACGWVARCERCESAMTLYQAQRRLRCHHCGKNQAVDPCCPNCKGTDLIPVGQGTERVEATLAACFPQTPVVRIDRDTTRRKNALKIKLELVNSGISCILVGTQMLAKGHHFPKVTFVGVINCDQGLFSADFRATERMAQLIVQVAGRAGRAERPGQVMIQTHYPEHPLLGCLIESGYRVFAQRLLEERCNAELPPYCYFALLRAEALAHDLPLRFLMDARQWAEGRCNPGVSLQGPVPAPMEKRAGRYRAQLLIQANKRTALHHVLTPWMQQLEESKLGRKVRWSIDVDPLEMY